VRGQYLFEPTECTRAVSVAPFSLLGLVPPRQLDRSCTSLNKQLRVRAGEFVTRVSAERVKARNKAWQSINEDHAQIILGSMKRPT
jgi:hypothetical protein